MGNLSRFALLLLIGLTMSPILKGQRLHQHPSSQLELFNDEASVTDPAEIHKYSEDLIGLVVPHQVSKGYIDSLAERLARAELFARTGKGKLVPEAYVTRSFNELMKEVGAPSNLRATDESLRRFREHAVAIKAFPALLSAGRNGANCNPGEAVFLLYLLLSDGGVLLENNLDAALELVQMAGRQNLGRQNRGGASSGVATAPEAQSLLSSYASGHNRNSTVKLFNHMADIFGF